MRRMLFKLGAILLTPSILAAGWAETRVDEKPATITGQLTTYRGTARDGSPLLRAELVLDDGTRHPLELSAVAAAQLEELPTGVDRVQATIAGPARPGERLAVRELQPYSTRVDEKPATITGQLTTYRGTARDGSPLLRAELVLDDGTRHPLELSAVAAAQLEELPTGVDRVQASIAGPARPGERLAVGRLQPYSMRVDVASFALTGSLAYVNLLCRFNDNPSFPELPAFFDGLMAPTYPGLVHFWYTSSFGNLSLSSQTIPWVTMSKPRAAYLNSDGTANLWLLASDCTAAADAQVDFRNVDGFNLMFNDVLDNGAWGAADMWLSRDGPQKRFRATWMPPWGYHQHQIFAQEMGHSLSLPHSSGPYSNTYDSHWDPMSDGGMCRTPDPTYGCLAPDTIAYAKDKHGWIPSARRVVTATTGSKTFELVRTNQPPSVGFVMAKIATGLSSGIYYTVEARRFFGYDTEVPFEGVLLHEVNPNRPDRVAQVVDVDNNSDPNDAGAVLTPGETYTHPTLGFSVHVDAATVQGYTVSITVPQRTLTVTKSGEPGFVFSSPGISCGSDCSEAKPMGASFVLTASPSENNVLDTWTGCNSVNADQCYVTLSTTNRTVNASFACSFNSCQDACLAACDALHGCENECWTRCTNQGCK
jgi:M6 family metalloprotease-like protein